MAQLAIAAAGAALGAATLGTAPIFLGLTGTAIGWTLGSIAGSFLGPTQKSQGPKLNDLRVSSGEYGQAIPFWAGHPRVSGQMWWASDRRAISNTTEVGKGGGGAEYTSYTYEVDLLIGLGESGDAVGISRIWSNGALVYAALDSVTDATLADSNEQAPWDRMTFYDGNAAQLPDPIYEASVTNAPAYRGRCTVFLEGLQLGSSGQLPNLTFELAQEVAPGADTVLLMNFEDGLVEEISGQTFANEGTVVAEGKFDQGLHVGGTSPGGGGPNAIESSTPSTLWDLNDDEDFTIEGWMKFNTQPVGRPRTLIRITEVGALSAEYQVFQEYGFAGSLRFAASFRTGASSGNSVGTSPVPFSTDYFHLAFVRIGDIYTFYVNGVLDGTSAPVSYRNPNGAKEVFIGNNSIGFVDGHDGVIDGLRIVRKGVYTTNFTPPATPPTRLYERYTLVPATLQDTVERLCARAGMPAGTYDATALASITKPVRALAVANVTSARSVIEQLAAAYYFEAYATDKLYFVPRGGAPVMTIDMDDMGAGIEQAAEQTLPINITPDAEIPAQISLSYINVDADYNAATEHSDRLLSGIVSTSALQLALGLTSSEAKGICDSMLMDGYTGRVSGELSLPLAYTALVPTDVVLATGPDGTQYRVRLVRRNDTGITVGFDWVLDDASVLQDAGISSDDYTPSIVVSRPGPSTLELLDIPLLRDADDTPGILGGVKPTSGTTWPGAMVYSSLDGVEYTEAGTVNSRAIIGTTLVALTNYTGGNVFDHAGSVTVNVGVTMSSATRDALLNADANAMLVGAEVIQYMTATYVSDGIYKLTGLLRGRRGTEWAMTGHTIGERVVMLRTAGLVPINYDAARIGLPVQYKAVTLGKSLSSASAKTITDTGVRLKPFAPVDLRVNTSVAGLSEITWERRSRLSYHWPAATALPLGEASLSFDVELYSPGDVLLDSQTVTSTSVTFSAATRTITLEEGAGWLQKIGSDYFGVQVEGNGFKNLLRHDAAGALTGQAVLAADAIPGMLAVGSSLYAVARYYTSGVPQTNLATRVFRIDSTDMSTDATHTATIAGDYDQIAYDGTSLWVAGYYSGKLFSLDASTLAATEYDIAEPGISGIASDGAGTLFVGNFDGEEVFAYIPGTDTEVWRVSTGRVGMIHYRDGLVYVVGQSSVLVLDESDGSTVFEHPGQVSLIGGTGVFFDTATAVIYKRFGSEAVVFLDAATGDIESETNFSGVTALAGVDGSTIFALVAPTGQFTFYQTWGYQVVADLTGYTVTVYQNSATVGRGYPASITL